MQKEDLLPQEVEKILIDIDFINKYKAIWEKYPYKGEDFKISYNEIKSVFNNYGFQVKKNNYQYFTDYYTENDFCYRIGISIRYNIIHFDISIKNEKIGLNTGGGFGLLVQLMTNWEMPINSPSYNSLADFTSLIGDLIALFEEIKFAIMKT